MRFAPRMEGVCNGNSRSAWEAHAIGMERVASGHEAFFLTVGNSDFPTPLPVVETAYQSLRAGRTQYAAIIGERPLRESIARRHAARIGQPVDADQVVVTIGAQNALFAAALCIAGEGDEVIVPEPMYVTYPGMIAAAGAKVVSVRSPAENGFHPLLDEIRAAVTPRTRAIFLATPNNPTGAVLTSAELEAIGKICVEHDLWLVSDEVYGDLVHDGRHVPPAGIPALNGRTVTVDSLSKSHAMAGWRLGWLVAPREFAEVAGSLNFCSTYGVPPFIQDAAVAALEAAPHGIPEIAAAYADRRLRLCALLNEAPGLRCTPPEAGMFVMLDVRATGLSAYDFAVGLVRETGVATLPTDSFGPSAAGFLRLSLGLADDRLDKAARRIADYAARQR